MNEFGIPEENWVRATNGLKLLIEQGRGSEPYTTIQTTEGTVTLTVRDAYNNVTSRSQIGAKVAQMFV